MLLIRRGDLLIASRILFTRLARPLTINVDIIDNHLLLKNGTFSEPDVNISCSFGRFVGCFDVASNQNICFYLAVKAHPDKEITHIFVYYLNSDYKTIQESEMATLKHYVPGLINQFSSIKMGVIDVRCSTEHCNQLSIFVEAISYSLRSQMIDNFHTLQIINVQSDYTRSFPSSLYSRHENLSNCLLDDRSARAFRDAASSLDTHLEVSLNNKRLIQPSVALISTRGHLLITIYHEDTRIVNYLIPHSFQFEDLLQLRDVENLVNSFYRDNISEHVYTRLYIRKSAKCDDPLVVTALWLALKYKPHIFTSLKERELIHIMQAHYVKASLVTLPMENLPRSPKPSKNYYDTSFIEVGKVTDLKLTCDLEYPKVLDNDFDTQATQILSFNEIRYELSFWREISKDRQRIRDDIVPPIHLIDAFTDLTQSYLIFLPCYHDGLKFMAKIWSKYAKTIVSPIVSGALPELCEATKEARFVIYPSKFINNLDYLLVVDKVKEEWIYLQPENAEHKDKGYFEEITKRYINSSYKSFAHFSSRSVFISNGNCHTDYTKIHLLMATYVIARLFRYCVELPNKIIYGEWELRKYANNICTELQLVNSQYNVDNKLVDDDGNLLEGAKESLPSPLRRETSIVPKDQCMYCLKRGFNNLGRHISMKHGGQASAASLSRLENN